MRYLGTMFKAKFPIIWSLSLLSALTLYSFMPAADEQQQLPALLHAINVDKAVGREFDHNREAQLITYKLLLSQCGDAVLQKYPEVADLLRNCSKGFCGVDDSDEVYNDKLKRVALIAKVFQGGSRPPILQYLMAMAHVDGNEPELAISQLEECLSALGKTGGSDEFRYLCLKKLIKIKWRQACDKDGVFTSDRAPKILLPDFFSCMGGIILERKFDFYASDRTLATSILNVIGADDEGDNVSFPGAIDALIDKLEKSPKSWLSLTIRGACYYRKAWEARGDGFANEVREQDWPTFNKFLAMARADLEEAWVLNRQNPIASDLMIDVSRSQGRVKEEQRLWFDRSLSAERDRQVSFVRLFFSLTPRWGGSLQSILSVGEEALATKDFDSFLPYRYLDAIYFIKNERTRFTTQEEMKVKYEFFTSKSTIAGTKLMFDGYIAHGDSDILKIDFLNFSYAFTVGYDQRQLKLGKDILERNGMKYINTSRHTIGGLTPQNLYGNLVQLIAIEEKK